MIPDTVGTPGCVIADFVLPARRLSIFVAPNAKVVTLSQPLPSVGRAHGSVCFSVFQWHPVSLLALEAAVLAQSCAFSRHRDWY